MILSFVFSMVLVGGVLLIVALSSPATAATYTQNFTAANWTSPSAWTCSAVGPGSTGCGNYPGDTGAPGAANGDLANVNAFQTLTVNTNVGNGVTLSQSNGTLVISPSGVLSLVGTSSVALSGGFFSINGGTLANTGTLSLSTLGGTLSFDSGTLSGAGQTNVNGAFAVTGSTGPMTIGAGQAVINNSTITFSSPTNALAVNGSIANASAFNITGAAPINGTGSIANTGTFSTTSTSTVGVAFNNGGTVNENITGAKFSFTGGGTHTGTFNTAGTGAGFDFGGAHTFNAGTFTGGPVQNLAGGSWIVNTALTISGAFTNGGNLSFNGVARTISPSTFTQSGTGAFSPRLLGNGVNDKLTATAGNANLGGTLSPTLGYSPANGDSFVVLTSSADSGLMAYAPVTYPGGQLQASFNAASVSLAAVATADISVSKTGPASVTAGQNATYTVTITNLDTVNTASAIQISDAPTGMAFVSNSGACLTPYPCTIASLAPLASATITSIYAVPSSATGTVSNTATRTASAPPDNTPANDSSTATSAVVQSADLSTTKTGPASALTGQTIVFSTTVTNNGPSDAANVSVADPTPAGLTFVSNTGACVSTFPCSLGTLVSGGSATITSTYTVNGAATSPVTNTATASATPPDPVPGNNSASASVTITPAADLSITKAGPPTVSAGANIIYTISVTNNGPSSANNVTVTDPTPVGTTFVSNSGACTIPFPCNVGTLTSGQTVNITSTFAVPANASGTVINTASVSAAGSTDSFPSNNTAAITTSIISTSDYEVVKSGPASAVSNSTISYVVNVTNLGPSNGTGPVVVSDPTPTGLTLLSISGGGCTVYPCSVGPLAAGSSVSITNTYKVTATSGSVTNTASVPIGAGDPVSTNNSSSVITTITTQADLSITKTGPSTMPVSHSLTFVITITNSGPSDALNVTVADPTPARLTFAQNTGDCTTAFPCSLGTIPAGGTKVINARYAAAAGSYSVANTASVSSITTDPVPSNNTSSWTVSAPATCVSAPTQTFPTNGGTAPTTGTITWNNVGADQYDVYFGPVGTGCTADRPYQSVSGTTTSVPYSGLIGGTQYESRIVASRAGCPTQSSSCVIWTAACDVAAPTLLSPLSGTVNSPVTFQWTPVANADTYTVYVGTNNTAPVAVGTTGATSLTTSVSGGSLVWYVVASSKNCPNGAQSPIGSFNACAPPDPPEAGVVGAPTSGQLYAVSWPAVNGAVSYIVDEATNDAFTDAVSQNTTQTSVTFTKTTTTGALVFFYRVKAVGGCTSTPSAASRTVRVVVVPPPANQRFPNFDIPAGTQNTVDLTIFIPGDPSGDQNFTITLDKPWMVKVTPSSGVLHPGGINVTLTVDPSALPNGTFTGTLLVTLAPVASTSNLETNATTPKPVPVTVNLVTPVTPTAVSGPTANTIIIPAVGRLTGLNAQWRSDVRVFNGSSQALKYQLDFVPSQASESKRTTINTAAGDTTALDDIIHNWYGFGEVGDSASGVLQIRALTSGGTPVPAGSSLATVVSSRTYDNTPSQGTLGQYIPGLLFSSFIGRQVDLNKAQQVLSLQQLAQNSSYRTNVGLIEASGSPATVLVSVLNSAGNKLIQDFSVSLKGGEQQSLNQLLAQKGITANDARLEVRVTGGDGKVTAYASVVDNNTLDPLLVSPVILGQTTARTYVLPGVADLNTGSAAWRTDLRILNGGNVPQAVDVLFYPQGNPANPVAASLTVNPGEVKVLDNVLASLFATTNAGGAVHVNTVNDSQLVVTGRTFNQTGNGTLGQFIPAATLQQGIDRTTRGLNILQVEDSVRYRTNVGLAEMSGQPATVQVSINLPDSKVTPTVQIPLAANEFRQFALRDLGLSNIYNARVTISVTGGNGKVTAYGSVIDMTTTDPTFVPAQ